MLMVTLALSPSDKVMTYPPLLIPTTITMKNFNEVMSAGSFFKYFINSVIISAVTTFGQMITCSMAGYAFARLNKSSCNFHLFCIKKRPLQTFFCIFVS